MFGGGSGFPLIDPVVYDIVVLGTGPRCSLIAAAAAIAGKQVLHIDPRPQYGAAWQSLSIKHIIQWNTRSKDTKVQPEKQTSPLPNSIREELELPENISLAEPKIFGEVGAKDDYEPEFPTFFNPEAKFSSEEDQKFLMSKSREFSIDRNPIMVFSSGPLVDLLIRSKTTDYFLFTAVDEQYFVSPLLSPEDDASSETSVKQRIVKLPISKSDIFQSKFLSLVEKRHLMKFVHQMIGNEERFANLPSNQADAAENDLPKSSFVKMLRKHDLSEGVTSMMLYGVCSSLHKQEEKVQDPTAILSTDAAVNTCKVLMASMKRYGDGCFLFPLYGLGSIPEMMCRKCSVFQGIYILPWNPEIIVDQNAKKVEGIVSPAGQVIKSPLIVADAEYLSSTFASELKFELFSHALLITSAPIRFPELKGADTKNDCVIFVIPPNDPVLGNPHPIRIIQLDASTRSSFGTHAIIHLETLSSTKPSEDLGKAIVALFPSSDNQHSDNAPRIMFQCMYQERVYVKESLENLSKLLPQGLYLLSEQHSGLSEIEIVQDAENLFHNLFVDAEFFPAPPEAVADDDAAAFDFL